MMDYDLVARLREGKYGHGAFGESESYPPPSIQIEAAAEIERLNALLVLKTKEFAKSKLTDSEIELLNLNV